MKKTPHVQIIDYLPNDCSRFDMLITLQPNEQKTIDQVETELKNAGINLVCVKVKDMIEQPSGVKIFTLEVTEKQ